MRPRSATSIGNLRVSEEMTFSLDILPVIPEVKREVSISLVQESWPERKEEMDIFHISEAVKVTAINGF
jgi:hypothetical protein